GWYPNGDLLHPSQYQSLDMYTNGKDSGCGVPWGLALLVVLGIERAGRVWCILENPDPPWTHSPPKTTPQTVTPLSPPRFLLYGSPHLPLPMYCSPSSTCPSPIPLLTALTDLVAIG
ncbi:hypothetical protein G9A89_000345, partial [Geosiphon pyriformis]